MFTRGLRPPFSLPKMKIFKSSSSGSSPFKKKTVAEPAKVKKAKKVSQEVIPLDEVDDADDEDLEVRPRRPQAVKKLALEDASKLGIKSFEVEREAFAPEDPDDDENRYKNARKNNERLVIPARLKDSDDRRVKSIVTVFGQRSDTILKLLEDDENTDGALTLTYRTLLQTMVDILPVIERGVRTSKGRKGVIPLNQTVSQIRELVTDIQSLRDRGQLGASIVEKYVRPSYLDLAAQISIAFMNMETSSRSKMSKEEFAAYKVELDETKRSLAKYLLDQYESLKTDIVGSMS